MSLPLPGMKPAPSLPLPISTYKRTPAITLDVLQKRANERGFHLYYMAYAIIEPQPWHLGYLCWLHARTEEAKRLRREHDFTAYILEWINSHPSKEGVK